MFSCKLLNCLSSSVCKQMMTTRVRNELNRLSQSSKLTCFSCCNTAKTELLRTFSAASSPLITVTCSVSTCCFVSKNTINAGGIHCKVHKNELLSGVIIIRERRLVSNNQRGRDAEEEEDKNNVFNKRSRKSKGGRFLNETNFKFRQTKRIIQETRERVKEKVEEIIMRENILTIPNLLCATRIAMSPLLVYLVLGGSYKIALGLFVVAGVTDLLDGYIARNFENQRSMFGSFLDPLADKLLVVSLVLSLTVRDLIPVPLTSLIILRDAALVAAGFYIRYLSLPPPKTFLRFFDPTLVTAQLSPTFISKANTTLQLVLVAATLTASLIPFDTTTYLRFLWYVTATSTVASGLSYVTSGKTYKLIKKITTEKRKQ